MTKIIAVCVIWLAGLVVCNSSQNCSHEGNVRLSGGSEFAGRVEVCANGTWGTICDRGWDHNDARVICNQLNLSNAAGGASCGSACFGEGTGKVLYRDVECNEENSVFSNCSYRIVGGGGNCSNHSRDAGVICGSPVVKCNEGDVRLRGGTEFTGRVEVCANGTWGTICDRGWDNDASVICNQLNLSCTDNISSLNYNTNKPSTSYQYETTAATKDDDITTDATHASAITSPQHDCVVIGGALGALSTVLALALGAVSIGWLMSCYSTRKKTSRYDNTVVDASTRSSEVVNTFYAAMRTSTIPDSHLQHAATQHKQATTNPVATFCNPPYATKSLSRGPASGDDVMKDKSSSTVREKGKHIPEHHGKVGSHHLTLPTSTTGRKAKDNLIHHSPSLTATKGGAGSKLTKGAAMVGGAVYAVPQKGLGRAKGACVAKEQSRGQDQNQNGRVNSDAIWEGAEYAEIEKSVVAGSAVGVQVEYAVVRKSGRAAVSAVGSEVLEQSGREESDDCDKGGRVEHAKPEKKGQAHEYAVLEQSGGGATDGNGDFGMLSS